MRKPNTNKDYIQLQKAVVYLPKEIAEEAIANLNINAVNPSGTNILLFAIANSGKLNFSFSELLDMCIKKEINLNYSNREGFTALHYCINYRNLDALKALLDHGADINVVNPCSGNTPLLQAVSTYVGEEIQLSIIQELLDRGANVEIKNAMGTSAKDFVENVGVNIDKGLNKRNWDLRHVFVDEENMLRDNRLISSNR